MWRPGRTRHRSPTICCAPGSSIRRTSLDLPVRADNVKIVHSKDGMRIDVRYFVRVNAPGYTVDLHFYPGAGSR